jgi:hypothetical protein
MSCINGFLPPFTGEVARTKCATKWATRVDMPEKRSDHRLQNGRLQNGLSVCSRVKER